MSVIKEEFINDKITQYDLLPIGFLKKSPYTGSKGKLRYRIEKIQEGEEPDVKKFLLVSTWTTPFSYDVTPKEELTEQKFGFSDEEIEKIIEYLNEKAVL
ncbi:MAG: hypothetical protein MJ063_01875 [Lachnospiraceae bacterium]|nr:hypothetical protein [Lachnospiraceae bacterium]